MLCIYIETYAANHQLFWGGASKLLFFDRAGRFCMFFLVCGLKTRDRWSHFNPNVENKEKIQKHASCNNSLPPPPPLQPSIFDLFREICWIKIPLEKFNCFKANVVVSTFWVPLCQKGDSDVQGGNHSTVRGGPIFVEMPPKLTGLPPKNPKKEVMFNHVGPTR